MSFNTHYRNDFRESAVEDGKISSYRNTDFIAGNIHKAVSPEAYVEYCKSSFNEKPTFFYMVKGREVPDLTCVRSSNHVEMILDSSIKDDLYVIYLDKSRMSYGLYHNSTSGLNWANRSHQPFGTETTF